MAREKESSKRRGISGFTAFIWAAIIFAIGYFFGMNHNKNTEIYTESEPQRQQITMKAKEYSSTAFEHISIWTQSAIQFIKEKASSNNSAPAE